MVSIHGKNYFISIQNYGDEKCKLQYINLQCLFLCYALEAETYPTSDCTLIYNLCQLHLGISTFLNLLKFLDPVGMTALLSSMSPSSSSCPTSTCTLTSGTHSTTMGADSVTGMDVGKYGRPSCAYTYIKKGRVLG